ncbi:glycosyltransferase family 2 protein [Uliginosibacterium gangwonense]|uniref:glycosyltransferase family 2 protein n=1 Tax=Uliginosibacterium gangwonense TaxID=392736 RepID=UPI00037DD206|nr:glycosyltransferase family 2 protein [Uliginosibacterium gangwonense]
MLQSASINCDVIIVNYNVGKLLVDCVRSALSEGVRRVVVVDNASHDGSVGYLESAVSDQRLCIIRNDANLGFAAACNVGIRACEADALLFLNPDCVLAAGSLPRMMDVLANNSEAGMVGGLLCNPDGSEQPGGRRLFPTPKRAFMRAFGLSRLSRLFPSVCSDFLLHQEALPGVPVAVEAISGACMLVKREALKDVGLWDEGYFLHCEDLDWCMRFQLKAWQIVFVPDAPVMHAWRACSRNRPFFVEWHKHRGMLRFYRKFFRQHHAGFLWWLVVSGVWLRFGLVSAYHAVRLPARRLGGGRV